MEDNLRAACNLSHTLRLAVKQASVNPVEVHSTRCNLEQVLYILPRLHGNLRLYTNTQLLSQLESVLNNFNVEVSAFTSRWNTLLFGKLWHYGNRTVSNNDKKQYKPEDQKEIRDFANHSKLYVQSFALTFDCLELGLDRTASWTIPVPDYAHIVNFSPGTGCAHHLININKHLLRQSCVNCQIPAVQRLSRMVIQDLRKLGLLDGSITGNDQIANTENSGSQGLNQSS